MASSILPTSLLLNSYSQFLRSGCFKTLSDTSVSAKEFVMSTPTGALSFEEVRLSVFALHQIAVANTVIELLLR